MCVLCMAFYACVILLWCDGVCAVCVFRVFSLLCVRSSWACFDGVLWGVEEAGV